MSPFDRLLSAQGFEPHGYCLLWNRWLISLHVVSDLVTGLSYLAIAATMVYLLRRARRDLPFAPIFVAFAAFILACGAAHFVDVYTLWVPRYWVQGSVKALTAVASLVTAIAFPFFVPAFVRTLAAARTQRESKTRLRAIFESQFDGIVLLEPVRDRSGVICEFTVTEANGPATRVLGRARGALVGRGLVATFPHVLENGSFAKWVSVANTGDAIDEELAMPSAVEGSSAEWVHRRSVRVDDGVLVVVRDVSERRRREAALGESEARYRALFHESGAMQWIVDAEREQIVDANAAAAAFYGYSCEELRGMPLARVDILPAAARTALIGRTSRGEVPLMVVSHRLASGEDREIEVRPTPVVVAGRLCTHSVLHDVTARRRAERELRESERRFSAAFDYAVHGIALVALDGRFLKVNRRLCALTGYTEHELLMRTFQEITHPDDVATDRAQASRLREGAIRSYTLEKRYLRKDGTAVLIAMAAALVRDDTGAPLYFVKQAEDITDLRAADAARRASEAQFRAVLENIRAPAVTLDAQGCVLFANDALLALTGWPAEEVVGRGWFERFAPDRPDLRSRYLAALATGVIAPHREETLVTRDGGLRMIAWDNVAVHGAAGQAIGTWSIGQDVTDRRALESRLGTLAEQDELTGLLNRRGFRRVASDALRSAQQLGGYGAVLYVDLDRFKPINDVYGHAAGDEALRAVAGILRATTRSTDSAARLGGDEFAICMVGQRESNGALPAVRFRTHLEAHNTAATAAGRPFRVECSVGVAEFGPGDDLDAVLARADAALYAEKLARGESARSGPPTGGRPENEWPLDLRPDRSGSSANAPEQAAGRERAAPAVLTARAAAPPGGDAWVTGATPVAAHRSRQSATNSNCERRRWGRLAGVAWRELPGPRR